MKFKHISTKFILAFVCILAAVFAVICVAISVVFPLSVNSYVRKNFLTMQSELDSGLTEVVNESAYLFARMVQSSNAAELNILADENATVSAKQQAFERIVATSGADENYFKDVTLYAGNNKFAANGGVDLDDAERAFFNENRNMMYYLRNDNGNLVFGINSDEHKGLFLFSMAESRFDQISNPQSGEQGYSFIMRSDGYVISHPDDQIVGKYIIYSDVYNSSAAGYKRVTLDGVKSIVVTSRAQLLSSRYGMDCAIISVLDYHYYFGNTETMMAVILAVSAAGLIAAVIIAVFRAKKLSKPITLLGEKINSTSKIQPAGPSVLQEGDELVQLERNYDEMINRIFDLVQKQKEDLQLQRKLELESLQMQINPHFLYNTLDAISWMAKIKKQPEIDSLVMNLAKFFRLFLHNGDKFVTVADEVEMVRSYLEIDKIRKSNKINYVFEIADDVKDKYVLKLILQPIIENCLKHAFSAEGGTITIRAYLQGEDLFFQVEDDGAGFDVPPDVLTHKPQKEGGYGLVNVHERLVLQYGEGYGLTIQSQKGKGTLVTAKLKSSV